MSRWLFTGTVMVICTIQLQPAVQAQTQRRSRGGTIRQVSAQQVAPAEQRPEQQTELPPRAYAMPTSDAAPGEAPAAGGTVLQQTSLEELVGYAEASNPILARSKSEIEAAKGERVQAGLYPNPRFETNNPEIWAGQQSFVNFGFQQDIVVKGKLRMEKAAADQLVRRESASYHVERMQMLTDIRKQYYVALAAKHRLRLTKYIVSVSQKGLDAAKQLEQAGEGALTDVLLLDTEVQRAMTRMENAESSLEGEYKLLAATVGTPDLVITDIEGSLLSQPPEFDEIELREFLANSSPYMAMGRAEIVRNSTLLRRAEVEAYPNLRMGPSYQTGTTPNSSQFWLSVVFDIPVWDLNQGNIRKARASVNGSAAELEIVKNRLLGQASDLSAQYRATRRVGDRIRTSILPNARRTQELVQDGFAKGQFEVNRLLQAQHNLSEVASNYIDNAEKLWVTAAELAGLMQLESFP